ncbi:MAG TPA: PPOX class F420-dependent oxidoreductase [bacterium]|jgi:PPOX class probable F420-dependent enzyme|nr:PPOX class F420-dependent oxidoreductase [bacterium]
MEIPEDVRRFLEKPNVAVLATVSPRGRPQATPVWFMLEDGQVLINTSAGRVKLRHMEANPNVALTIVDPENIYTYVQIRGRVVRFDRENGARDIDRLSMRYHGRSYRYLPTDAPEKRVSLLIRPRTISNLRRR